MDYESEKIEYSSSLWRYTWSCTDNNESKFIYWSLENWLRILIIYHWFLRCKQINQNWLQSLLLVISTFDTPFLSHYTFEKSMLFSGWEGHAVKASKIQVFVSGLVITKDKLNKKGNEVNELLKNKCGIRQLSFIDNKNISLGMLNESWIHLNEYGTTRLVNNFCYSMTAWRDETCMGAKNNTEKEESAIAKRVKKNLAFNVNSSNTNRSVNPAVDTKSHY